MGRSYLLQPGLFRSRLRHASPGFAGTFAILVRHFLQSFTFHIAGQDFAPGCNFMRSTIGRLLEALVMRIRGGRDSPVASLRFNEFAFGLPKYQSRTVSIVCIFQTIERVLERLDRLSTNSKLSSCAHPACYLSVRRFPVILSLLYAFLNIWTHHNYERKADLCTCSATVYVSRNILHPS